jgi:NAD(P)-dependent dehydrogenase (short-subunit alcohol dehydrogenase family)
VRVAPRCPGTSATRPTTADGITYLASDEARYVTGEELVLHGGWVTH